MKKQKFCKNCKKEINRNAKKYCKSCAKKGKLNSSYKHGKYCKISICIDCGKETKYSLAKRCSSCHIKYININNLKRLSNPKNHWNWQNGKSFEEYGKEFDNSLKEQVRFRDKYTCQECGCSQLENGRQLDCHHIDYNKKNNNLQNLLSLCMRCHRKTTSNKNYWIKYYTDKILYLEDESLLGE
jgi:hypothetical protein